MARSIREYTACWVRHDPNLEIGEIQFVTSDLTDVSTKIDRASKYDPEASFSLIERFCSVVNANSDIDDRLMRYIVRALQALIRDNRLNLSLFAQTLGIKSKAHRPKKEKRDQEVFFEVREHMIRQKRCVPQVLRRIYRVRPGDRWHGGWLRVLGSVF